ncbi:MAG TPA: ATP-binding protein [Bryobacteraceae bacterium]|nr:ATP-binding protein [Bryobacteraceae bacterium]
MPVLEVLVWFLCLIVLALVIHHLRRTRTLAEPQTAFIAQDLFETAPIGFLEIDRSGVVQRANAQCARMLGRERVQIVGQRWEQIISSADQEKDRDLLAQKFSGKAPLAPYQREYLRPDGARIFFQIHEELLTEPGGAVTGMRMAAVDTTQRFKIDERAFLAASDLRAFFAVFPDLFLRLDRNGIVQDAKGGAQQDPILQSDKFRGRGVNELLPDDAVNQFKQAQEEARRTKSAAVFEFAVEALEPQIYEMRLVELDWDWAAILRNVTARKTGEAKLQEYAEELERKSEELENALITAREATQLKSRFLATMSHEIRTPVNGVLGMTDVLLNTPLELEQQEYAQSIKRSATSLLSLIDDILDVARIEAGRLRIERAPFSLKTVLDETVSLFGSQARAKGLEFTCEIVPNVPVNVVGDPKRVQQVLSNLLGNAVKFTDAGRIGLKAVVSAESDDNCEVRFSVSDTGIGIAPEYHSAIFEKFMQADTSSTRKHGGTGLGLAISKEIVELMGGEIGVESEPERGSEFWFTLSFGKAKQTGTTQTSGPAASSKPAAQVVRPVIKLTIPASVPVAPSTTSSPSSPLKRDGLASLTAAALDHNRRVLLAEDNEVNQRIAVRLLEKLGLHADVAHTGREAVDAASKKQYGLILMDCQMPEMDGFEAAAVIRNRERNNRRTPICALTANAIEGDRERCLAAGMDDYLPKPISLEKLREAVERWMPGAVKLVEPAARPT